MSSPLPPPEQLFDLNTMAPTLEPILPKQTLGENPMLVTTFSTPVLNLKTLPLLPPISESQFYSSNSERSEAQLLANPQVPNVESVVVTTTRNMAGTSAQPFVPRELFDHALSRIAQLEFDVIWLKNQMATDFSQYNLFADDKKGEQKIKSTKKRDDKAEGEDKENIGDLMAELLKNQLKV